MHIPDGFLSAPVTAGSFAVSALGVGIAVSRLKGRLEDKQVPLLGVTAAFVFAAQMLNFPVAAGTSGHFLGAAFLTALLGPGAALLVLSLVISLQCLLFADGGLTALGANVLNMGLVAVGTAWLVQGLGSRLPRKPRLWVTGLSAWISVVAASIACAAELALSGAAPWKSALFAMAGVHAVIGVGEALITVSVLSVVAKTRPDLLSLNRPVTPGVAWEGRP